MKIEKKNFLTGEKEVPSKITKHCHPLPIVTKIIHVISYHTGIDVQTERHLTEKCRSNEVCHAQLLHRPFIYEQKPVLPLLLRPLFPTQRDFCECSKHLTD